MVQNVLLIKPPTFTGDRAKHKPNIKTIYKLIPFTICYILRKQIKFFFNLISTTDYGNALDSAAVSQTFPDILIKIIATFIPMW